MKRDFGLVTTCTQSGSTVYQYESSGRVACVSAVSYFTVVSESVNVRVGMAPTH